MAMCKNLMKQIIAGGSTAISERTWILVCVSYYLFHFTITWHLPETTVPMRNEFIIMISDDLSVYMDEIYMSSRYV